MSKEMDAIRKRQIDEAAAGLKAKLDMVTLRDKPAYGRRPRKIGEMICDTGIKAGYRNQTAKFILRLDEKVGEFIAEHGDFWYVSKSRDALQEKMNQVARVTFDLEWSRYLHIEYKATVQIRSSWHGGTTDLDVDDKREKDKPILGISLTWEIVEYSNAIRLPGDDDDRYMTREVDEDGEASETQESKNNLPPGLVIYTKEREQLLKGIRVALGGIDKKMCDLFGGTPDQVAKRLDTASSSYPLLLAAPKKEKR